MTIILSTRRKIQNLGFNVSSRVNDFNQCCFILSELMMRRHISYEMLRISHHFIRNFIHVVILFIRVDTKKFCLVYMFYTKKTSKCSPGIMYSPYDIHMSFFCHREDWFPLNFQIVQYNASTWTSGCYPRPDLCLISQTFPVGWILLKDFGLL